MQVSDNFFDKLCRNEDYTNSRLREDTLNLLYSHPYLTEHVDYAVFMPSRFSYGVFRAIRSLHKAELKKIALWQIYGELTGVSIFGWEQFVERLMHGDRTADWISNLIGVSDKDFYWLYGYCVLKWRIDNEVAF